MIEPHSKHVRVLAIAPSTRGFGFAVLEGFEHLVDWGVKSVEENKNAQCLVKVEELIAHYLPTVVVLQNHSSEGSRHSARIRALGKRVVGLALRRKVKVKLFSNEQVKRAFFADGKGTKYALAEILAGRFPEELGFRLPPKRRAWMSEDYRMAIFDAVALALLPQLPRKNVVSEVRGRSRGFNGKSPISACGE
jgi:Holliday junction resolvasome RuvABC endonuclease subunit